MEKSTQPLVSVIIPFLNEELYLGEAIESVLTQDYVHWELLLVDDGATAACTALAKKYAAEYPTRIFYLQHEGHANKGVCVSRNLGVKKAKGRLVAILDADDVWLSEKLSGQVAIFLKYPQVGLIAEGSVHWYNWENETRQNVIVPVGAPADRLYQPLELLKKLYPLGDAAAPGPCAWLLKRSAIIRAGGFEESFTKQFQLYEDQAFLCKIYTSEKVYISSASNNLYRQRCDSVVKWVKKKGFEDEVRAFFFSWLEVYLDKKQVTDKEVRRLLQRRLFPYRHPLLCYLTVTGPHMLLKLSKKAFAR